MIKQFYKTSSNPLLQAMVALIGLASAEAATIGTPAFTQIDDSTSPNYDLTVIGSQNSTVCAGDPVWVSQSGSAVLNAADLKGTVFCPSSASYNGMTTNQEIREKEIGK